MLTPLAGARILVVDDERAIATTVSRRLEQEGASCVVAHGGDDARPALAAGGLQVLITDLALPGVTGFELLDLAQATPDPPAVLLMAGSGDMATASAALSRGADGYVAKPVDLDLLVREVGRLVELRQLREVARGAETARAAGPTLVVLGEIVSAAEKSDPYRAGFSSRTARLAAAMAGPLGLPGDVLTLAARVHDVGMLAVPAVEQHVDGPLARPVQHLVRVHPTLGARWVERLGADRAIVAAVAAHHERWDGGGYPGGLAGEDIPPLARALGTAASVVAMSGPRAYRARMGVDEVMTQLEAGRLKQFGAAEADAAIAILMRMPELVA